MVLVNRLQSSNGDTDVEDRPVEAVGKERVGQADSSIETYSLLYVK